MEKSDFNVYQHMSAKRRRGAPAGKHIYNLFFFLLNGHTEFDDIILVNRYFDSASFGTKL